MHYTAINTIQVDSDREIARGTTLVVNEDIATVHLRSARKQQRFSSVPECVWRYEPMVGDSGVAWVAKHPVSGDLYPMLCVISQMGPFSRALTPHRIISTLLVCVQLIASVDVSSQSDPLPLSR